MKSAATAQIIVTVTASGAAVGTKDSIVLVSADCVQLCATSVEPSPDCVPAGHGVGCEDPSGQKKPGGHMVQLDNAWSEQMDEYVPAAQA